MTRLGGKVAAWGVVLVLALVLIGCGTRTAVDPGVEGTTAVPIVAQSGGNSPALASPGAWLITSQDQLAATGSEELQQLNVDFNTHALVVLALGEKPSGGYWAQITGVQSKGQALYVQALANRPGPSDPVTLAVTYPYAAAVVEKVSAQTVHPEVESVEGRAQP